METKKTKCGDANDFVANIVKKAVDKDKSLHETTNNHISGGRVGLVDYSYSFYNPHNARFYFKFNKWNFHSSPDFIPINHGSELKLDSFHGCRFVVKRSQIEVTNLIDSVRRFTISGSDSDRKAATLEAQSILEREAISALRLFVSSFGGACDFVCLKRHVPDNKVLHDEIVDSLDLDSTWNDDVSKKVYKTQPLNVEFKKPVYSANYFRNAGLRAYAPDIASAIDAVAVQQKRLSDEALIPLTAQIKLHLEVMQDMKDTLKDIRNAQMGARFESKQFNSTTSFSSHPENVGGDVSLITPVSMVSDSTPSTYPFHKALSFIKRRRLN